MSSRAPDPPGHSVRVRVGLRSTWRMAMPHSQPRGEPGAHDEREPNAIGLFLASSARGQKGGGPRQSQLVVVCK